MKTPFAFLTLGHPGSRAACAAAAITALFVAQGAHASTGTWTGAALGTWDTSDTNWSGVAAGTPWDSFNGPTNTAVFSASSTLTLGSSVYASSITPAAGATLGIAVTGSNSYTINSPFAQASTTGNIINKTDSGTLILAGNTVLVGDVNSNLVAGFTADGGGELQITGGLKAASTLQSNRGNFTNTVGTASAGNTLRISGAYGATVYAGGLTVGGGTFGSNKVYITRPGNAASPSYNMSGNGQQLNLGVSSSGNTVEVSNGAYFMDSQGGGTQTWSLGVNAGANNNSMTITGLNSIIYRTSSAALTVGVAGNSNSVTVSDKGTLVTAKIQIGINGGNNNFVHVTGAGSSVSSVNTQANFEIGSNRGMSSAATVGGDGNYLLIDGGASFIYNQSTTRGYNIGAVTGADNNYVEVTGTDSVFTMKQAMPLAIGGATGNNNGDHNIVDSSASGNHLDIFSGARSYQNSLYVMGVNSAVNLGDGTGVSQMEVGASTGNAMYAAGVVLYNSTARLNINSGRLIAGANGALVSGAGEVVLNGPAYFSTAQAASTIGSVISGSGSLTKEGVGTLTLATGTNTYSGDTTLAGGILELTSPNPNNQAAAVTIDTSVAMLNLNYGSGDDVVGSLVIDNVTMPDGTYGSSSSAAPLANQYDNAFAVAGTGTITVVTPSSVTYASWATDKGISGEPADGDYDNDGVDNAVEMVLGGDPKLVMDAGLLPQLALVTDPAGVPAGNYLEFTYRRTDLSVTAGLTADCEYDTDLVPPWTTAVDGVGGVEVLVDNDYAPYGTATDRVRVYVPRAANAKLFGRLHVTVP